MAELREAGALLPDGTYFDNWETDAIYDREYHVDCMSPDASDDNDGSASKPFKTINAAAAIAVPGTRVIIHAGTYRETVRPAKGGESPERMISYEAAGDGEVIIKASVVAKNFERSTDWNIYGFGLPVPEKEPVVWQTKLDPDEYRGYNPFCSMNILHDRLYIEYDKTDMTTYLNRCGVVFVDGKPLKQVSLYNKMSQTAGTYWVEANGQTVHFRLADDGDPADHLIELSCREQCFAPEIPFLNYIRVAGLTCAHASMGAPVPQRGSISCFRGHHWIIEDCKIDWSNAVGIDCGFECWHRPHYEGQVNGFTIIRRNKIIDAGVCGIAGMFTTGLLIEDNLIEGTGWQKMELSWEAAGIKVHNCINSLFRRNVFRNTIRCDALWMDVGNENNRVTQNLFLDGKEAREAIFMECTRDIENLFDNNIIWNVEGRFDESAVPHVEGSALWYALDETDNIVNGYGMYGEGTDYLRMSNNIFGKCRSAGYFQKPVAFRLMGRGGTARDAKVFNNIFYECGEAAIKFPTKDNRSEGNLFMNMPDGYLRVLFPAPEECLDLKSWREFHGFDLNGGEADFNIEVDSEKLTMKIIMVERKEFPFGHKWIKKVHDPEKLEKVAADEKVDTDYFGNKVAESTRIPGPFTELKNEMVIDIDPRKCK